MTEKQILDILKYNVSRSCIGALVPDELSAAYNNAHTHMDESFPLRVGDINGLKICDAIWHQMSYNPVRFGTVSPFKFDGRNNIYRFCRGHVAPGASADAATVFGHLRQKLSVYMMLNGGGRWRDDIDAHNGYVYISSYGSMYAVLAKLRDCIKIVARQNVSDFKDKSGKYRAAIIDAVLARQPNKTMAPKQIVSDADMAHFIDSELYGAHDGYLELCQSIVDNRDDYCTELYDQALRDMDTLRANAGAAHTR